MPGYENASTSAVPSTVKSQTANDLVHMCATDIRLFSIVDGSRFKKVAHKLISIGAQYGNVSAGDVLPCPSTVSRHLESMVACRKSELRDKMAEAVNVAVTTDGWTLTLTNVQYITTTVHYIDKDWNMQAHILAKRPAVDKHTADYIRNFVVDVLLEFGLQKEGDIFMTDNAANIKHTAKRTRQTVHVDRLLLCKTPPPAVPDADSGVPPDTQTTTDGPDNPDEESQPVKMLRRPFIFSLYPCKT